MCLKILIHRWGRKRPAILEFSQSRPTEDAREPEKTTRAKTESGDIDPSSPSKSLSGKQTCSSTSVDCNIVHEESSASTGGTDSAGSIWTAREQIKVTKRILAILVSANSQKLVFDDPNDSIGGIHRGTETPRKVSKADLKYFKALRNELGHLKVLLSRQQKEEIITGIFTFVS